MNYKINRLDYMLQVKITNKIDIKIVRYLAEKSLQCKKNNIEASGKGDYFHIPLIKDISGQL